MPTITIRTGPLPASRRRSLALRLTRWLVGEGVSPDHAVIRIEEQPAGSVFVGGLPAEALDGGGEAAPHASVTCQVGPDRDEAFRRRLAETIAGAMPGGDRMPFLYLDFRDTAPADVWIGRYGTVRRAGDGHPTTEEKR